MFKRFVALALSPRDFQMRFIPPFSMDATIENADRPRFTHSRHVSKVLGFTFKDALFASHNILIKCTYRVFHWEMSISAPRLDLGSKFQQILTLVRAGSIWDCQPLRAKARAMPVDFSDALDIKSVR
jgi:hypothetical protein